ncbi:MAG: hypothetical protein K6F50_01410 [Kiritimatiellae bacterium]|nr:hypothetical protein [Kiritimatiellia bacterium]
MIVKMKHLDLLCVASSKSQTLERLRSMGAVHLDLTSASGAEVSSARGDAADAESAVRAILKARGKTAVASPTALDVKSVLSLAESIARDKSSAEELSRIIAEYEPYGDFDPALARKLLDEGIDLKAVAEIPETLPPKRLSEMQADLAAMEKRIGDSTSKLAQCDENAILVSYPELADRIAFAAAKELMSESGEIAFVSGWIPAPDADAFRAESVKAGWGILLRDPVSGEVPPTLVEPPKMFRPMKALFAGLGIAPAYTEADVSVPFMCYFALFFAMLVGDGAYGAIFLLSTLLMAKKLPKSWFILLMTFSISTVAWGFLSNTWFGANIPWCRNWPTVKWLADSTYHNMMLLCFTIGVSHLMLARIWNGVCKLPDSTAVAEFGWAGVLLFMYLVTNSIVGIFRGIPSWSFWVFGVSLVAVFGFSVKPSELKTRGAELGMLPLNIMSALGDIISYVRLFAVGLASVKVAENFNSMATGLVAGDGALWVKALMSVAMVLILVVGHGLNLAMAGLSILVHAVRLNTLEFSNHKGVSWAGYAFKPFKKN